MTATPLQQAHERTLADTTARLLAACASTAGPLGLGAAALATVALLLHPPGTPTLLLLGVLAVAPGERVLALRVRFDAGLFAELAGTTLPQPLALAALDQALQSLGLRRATPTLRPLHERVGGARRLAAWHAGCVALQCLALVAGAVASSRVVA